MASETFLPIEGATLMFDVVRNGEVIGLVWTDGEAWLADPSNMAAPAIREQTREAAAAKL